MDDASSLIAQNLCEFEKVVLQETLHRPGCRIAQCANRVAFDLVGNIQEFVQVVLL